MKQVIKHTYIQFNVHSGSMRCTPQLLFNSFLFCSDCLKIIYYYTKRF